jgi:hypothetical protein
MTEVKRTAEELAKVLLTDIQDSLDRGTKHFALDGRELLTVAEVLEALRRDRKILLEPKTADDC